MNDNMSGYLSNAVAHLNNTGVSLACRGCFLEALATLNDALKILRSFSLQGELIGEELREEVQCQAIQEALENASTRRIQATALENHPERPELIQVLSGNERLSTGIRGSSSKGCMIQLEPLHTEPVSETELSVQSSIILYNYGISFQNIAAKATDVTKQRGLLMKVLLTVELVYSTLYNREFVSETFLRPKVNLILVLSLEKLIEISSKLGLDSKKDEYTSCLELLQLETGNIHLVGDDLVPMPAAAA